MGQTAVVDEPDLVFLFVYDIYIHAFRPVLEAGGRGRGSLVRLYPARLVRYAKATEPLHWLIYGAGAYGFWKMSRWMWPWAGVYAAQVCIAMFAFGLIDGRGTLLTSLVSGAIFLIPTVALFRAREQFQPPN